MHAGSVGVDLLVWTAAGVASLIQGLCMAELGTMLPFAGGPYEFVSVAAESMGRAGDILSFLFIWVFVLLDPAAVAIHALTFTSYALSGVYGTCRPPYAVTALVTVGVIELAAVVNTLSLKASMKLQNMLFIIKIAILLAIIFTGIAWCFREPALLHKFTFDGPTTPVKIVESFAVALLTSAGSSMVACMAEEMTDPSRTIPRSLLGGTLLVTTLMVLTNVAYFSVLDLQALAESEATAVIFARSAWGAVGALLVPVIVCVCTFGTMSAAFLSNSRLLMAAARKRHLPAAFALITVNSSLPVVAIACRCFISLLLAVTGSVAFLAKSGMIGFCVMVFLEMTAMLRLRVTMKDAPRPIRVPTWLILVNIAICLTIVLVPLMAAGEVLPYVIAVGSILTGFPAYFVLKALQRSNCGIQVNRCLQKVTFGVPSVRQ
nr:Y+L amino acid transporter 2-like [Rhipicephalus microplus]